MCTSAPCAAVSAAAGAGCCGSTGCCSGGSSTILAVQITTAVLPVPPAPSHVFTQPPPAGEGTERGALLAAAGSVFHHAVLYVKCGKEVRCRWLGLPRAWAC